MVMKCMCYQKQPCMTEYRVRRSLHFTYQELGNRELNTIHHEALIEGIEATFGEVDKLVNSTKVAKFNPIEEFIADIPQWDGKDRLKELARLTHTSEAAVCKWLSGTHNFTFSTIGKISAALGAPIIKVPTSSYNEIIETDSIMVAEDDAEYGKP